MEAQEKWSLGRQRNLRELIAVPDRVNFWCDPNRDSESRRDLCRPAQAVNEREAPVEGLSFFRTFDGVPCLRMVLDVGLELGEGSLKRLLVGRYRGAVGRELVLGRYDRRGGVDVSLDGLEVGLHGLPGGLQRGLVGRDLCGRRVADVVGEKLLEVGLHRRLILSCPVTDVGSAAYAACLAASSAF